MATVTFDTLRLVEKCLVEKLKTAGFAQEQAEAAEAQDELVTKSYLDAKLEKELAPLRTDLAVVKWMIGVLLAGVLSLILKAFF